MSVETWIVVVAGITLVVNILGHISTNWWAVRRNNRQIFEGIDARIKAGDEILATRIRDHEQGVGERLDKVEERILNSEAALFEKLEENRRDLSGKIVDVEGNVGETFLALREKMRDMEIWNRDNFVGKTTFEMLTNEQRESWRRLEDQIETKVGRLSTNLETHNSRVNERLDQIFQQVIAAINSKVTGGMTKSGKGD